MNPEVMKKLVEQAREDPEFFHALVFDTENVLGKLDYLDRNAKASLVAISPEQIVAILVGEVGYCGNTCSSSCDNTCGGSCGYTTNLTDQLRFNGIARRMPGSDVMGCGNTCTSSCDNTCGQSCGFTTNLTDDRFRFDPASRFGGFTRWGG